MINQIMLIDDDEVNNFTNEKLIAFAQIAEQVISFTKVEDSIHYLDLNCVQQGKKPPELIFLDISMPSMDGFDFIQIYSKMKIKKESTQIVVLTSSSDERDYNKMSQLGIKGYIVKPLTIEKLKSFAVQ